MKIIMIDEHLNDPTKYIKWTLNVHIPTGCSSVLIDAVIHFWRNDKIWCARVCVSRAHLCITLKCITLEIVRCPKSECTFVKAAHGSLLNDAQMFIFGFGGDVSTDERKSK